MLSLLIASKIFKMQVANNFRLQNKGLQRVDAPAPDRKSANGDTEPVAVGITSHWKVGGVQD